MRKEQQNNDNDSLKSKKDYPIYNMFENIASIEEIDIAQKQSFSDRQ
jgi:hypothetical protein